MSRKAAIQIYRGLEKNIGILKSGELGYCTDTKKLYMGTEVGNVLLIAAQTVGDMLKSIYDTDNDGIVDAAENAWKVNNYTVNAAVPADAKFTDTVYVHPTTHLASMITQNANYRFTTDTEKSSWNGKASGTHTHNYAGSASAGGAATTALTCSGNAATATRLATARKIGNASFDGSTDISLSQIGVAASSHTHASYVNQNAFSNVMVGNTTIAADNTTDVLTLEAGSNVTLTPDSTNDKVTISATNTVYTHPAYTSKTSGLYKVTVDGTGHVSATSAVTKTDITTLGIPAQDTVYAHPTTAGNKHIPAGGSNGQILKWSADGIAAWENDTSLKADGLTWNDLKGV